MDMYCCLSLLIVQVLNRIPAVWAKRKPSGWLERVASAGTDTDLELPICLKCMFWFFVRKKEFQGRTHTGRERMCYWLGTDLMCGSHGTRSKGSDDLCGHDIVGAAGGPTMSHEWSEFEGMWSEGSQWQETEGSRGVNLDINVCRSLVWLSASMLHVALSLRLQNIKQLPTACEQTWSKHGQRGNSPRPVWSSAKNNRCSSASCVKNPEIGSLF